MRDEVGVYLSEGIAAGIDKGADSVRDSMTDLAKSTMTAAEKSFANSGLVEMGSNLIGGIAQGIDENAKALASSVQSMTSKAAGLSQNMLMGMQMPALAGVGAMGSTSTTNVVNNFNQTINAPKQPSRIELYRQSRNLLNLKGGA